MTLSIAVNYFKIPFVMYRRVWCTGKRESRFRSIFSSFWQSYGEKYCRGRNPFNY